MADNYKYTKKYDENNTTRVQLYEWEPKVLRVRSEFVHDPCEVRYGWGDFKPGNLKNAEGLPVAPFWVKLN